MLAIASAGWFFDRLRRSDFQSDQRAASGRSAALRSDRSQRPGLWRDRLLAVFLVGGTTGGVLFGTLADRYGRKSMMSVTILCYSVFSGLTYFATSLWHVAVLRFLVALGVGGEWAVAATLVAEVFPADRAGPRLGHLSGDEHSGNLAGGNRRHGRRGPVAVRLLDRHSSGPVGPLGSGQGRRAGAVARGPHGRSAVGEFSRTVRRRAVGRAAPFWACCWRPWGWRRFGASRSPDRT